MDSLRQGRFLPNPKLKLREQVREVMRFFHFSQRTEETYWQWIVRYLRFHRGKAESGKLKTEHGAGEVADASGTAAPAACGGTDIGTVQDLLGHRQVATTQIYTHVMARPGLGVRSPLDG